jgi:demethoxyubiquinone hydroxylase (CLK1/Coq7/Cat5 family)
MQNSEHAIERLNSLLRGELSAVETYQQALKRIGEDTDSIQLRQLHQDHIEAANILRQQVHQHGGRPDHGSGAWGLFAQAIERTASLFGNTTAMKALRAGEERGIRDYERALQEPEMPAESQLLIRSDLLPRTRTHIHVLERLMMARENAPRV